MHARLRTALAGVLLVAYAAAAATPIETTTVEGQLPEVLAGRWLVVEQTRLRTGMIQPFARLWEIRTATNGMELVLARRRLPEAVARQLTAAGSASRAWVPDDEAQRRIAERWDVLPETVTDVESIQHRLVAGANQSELEIVTEERFSGARPVTATRSTYTVRAQDAGRLVGRFKRVSEVNAPPPLSIALDGEFQAYRLSPAPPRSRLRRLLDAWLGREEPS